MKLTPQEKWDRLNHPTCADDYGIHLSRKEAEQVPELKPMMAFIDNIRKERKANNKAARELGKNLAETVDAEIISVLTATETIKSMTHEKFIEFRKRFRHDLGFKP